MGDPGTGSGRLHDRRNVVSAMNYETQAFIEQLQQQNAESRAEIEERRDRRLLDQPVVADWTGCKSVGEMSTKQFSDWCGAGKPPLAPKQLVPDAVRQHIEARLQTQLVVIAEEVGIIRRELRKEIAELQEQQRREMDLARAAHEMDMRALKAELEMRRRPRRRGVLPMDEALSRSRRDAH